MGWTGFYARTRKEGEEEMLQQFNWNSSTKRHKILKKSKGWIGYLSSL